ncbi:hypothetical protein [Lacibacter sp. H407]|uniref:hypothetical protein n=1 Tax=Lacibacter sp. H407 TaxID=3133423 RepID=UPI0030C03E9A
MKLEKSLFQKSYLYFIGFFLFVIAGFWVTYFTKLLEQDNYRMHTHGITLILWCLMLILQPYLIRTKCTRLHRTIGKFSYVLVPLLIYTTMDLLKYRLQPLPQLGTMDYFFVALAANALVAFAILYGLAIYHRKKATIHARYMVCTAFTMFTPVTDRLIHIHFREVLAFMPTIEGNHMAPFAGFLLADLLLIGLCIWDWRSHKRYNVFPVALLILLLYHISVFTFHRFDFWRSFCDWFVHL